MNESAVELFVGAPEDATHYNINNQMFYKFNGNAGSFWNDSHSEWLIASSKHEYPAMIERPKWSGPQDGLPPVGSRVEIVAEADEYAPDWNRYADHIGKTVTIIAHETASCGAEIAVYSSINNGAHEYHSLIAKCFSAIRTPQQLAAERRETSIREIMDVAGIDCLVTATKLVDAGFKREVV